MILKLWMKSHGLKWPGVRENPLIWGRLKSVGGYPWRFEVAGVTGPLVASRDISQAPGAILELKSCLECFGERFVMIRIGFQKSDFFCPNSANPLHPWTT